MKKPLDKESALLKMADLCSRGEQAPADIRRKLILRGLSHSDVEEVMGRLTRDSFLDTARFARSFANDKLRFSGWGRFKIRAALAAKSIPAADIGAAIDGLDPEEYDAAIRRVAAAKASSLDLSSVADRRRLFRLLASRGFESPLIVSTIRSLLPDKN